MRSNHVFYRDADVQTVTALTSRSCQGQQGGGFQARQARRYARFLVRRGRRDLREGQVLPDGYAEELLVPLPGMLFAAVKHIK